MNDNYIKKDQIVNAIMKLRSYLAGIFMLGGVAAVLAACGGGAGGALSSLGSSIQATFSGAAIDAAIPNAFITITSGAPLNDPGATTIGTITANASGVFTTTVTLPGSGVPVFGNAEDPKNTAVILSSYLGQSTALAAAGTLTSSNLPDLDITPVTTAALAVYAQINAVSGIISYDNLTPTTYATTLQQYKSDILAIAAAIKAVGDNLCTPAITVSSTTNLAASIAALSSLTSGNSTTLATAAATLGGNCPAVLASLPQEISADPHFGPELDMGEVIDAGASGVVPSTGVSGVAVTYTLQGVFAESGRSTSSVAASSVAASVFNDTAVTVDPSGNISSTDGNVSGALVGNLITLNVTNGAQQYSLRGKIGVIQSALVTGGTAFSIQAGGTNTSTQVLTSFSAVLSSAGVTPVWNGISPPTTGCGAGAFPVRLETFGLVGGGNLNECVAPSATGLNLSAAATGSSYFDDRPASSVAPSLSSPISLSEVTPDPFILSAPASVTINGTTTSGTMYYVMGTTSIVFASSTGNSLLNMDGNRFTQLTESIHIALPPPSVSGILGNNYNNGNPMNRYYH